MSTSNPQPGDVDARVQFLLASIESHDEQIGKLIERVKDVEDRFNARTDRILTATENLLAIANAHQERLDKLDGGNK